MTAGPDPELDESVDLLAGVNARLDRIETAIRGLASWCPNYGAADYRAVDEILKGERE